MVVDYAENGLKDTIWRDDGELSEMGFIDAICCTPKFSLEDVLVDYVENGLKDTIWRDNE